MVHELSILNSISLTKLLSEASLTYGSCLLLMLITNWRHNQQKLRSNTIRKSSLKYSRKKEILAVVSFFSLLPIKIAFSVDFFFLCDLTYDTENLEDRGLCGSSDISSYPLLPPLTKWLNVPDIISKVCYRKCTKFVAACHVSILLLLLL